MFFFCNEKLSKSQVRARVNVLSMGGLCKETERGSKRWAEGGFTPVRMLPDLNFLNTK